MRLLVTGAAGFSGSWLVRRLLHEPGVELKGLVRRVPDPGILPDRCRIAGDLLDRDRLMSSVGDFCPDAIIHLGGLTRGDLADMLRANVVGTKNILDAGSAANPDCRILVASSSAVYGYPGTGPIPESTPLHPLSEYGISKMAQEELALMHHALNGSCICIARPFNLAGPGQPDSFLCGSLVRQVAEIEEGKKDALELRETSSSRDLVDVRDVAGGYWALVSRNDFATTCCGKVFNIGSGNACPVTAIIGMLKEITGRTLPVNIPGDAREPVIPSQVSDNRLIGSLTGWRPHRTLPETLRDMLDAARKKRVG